MLELGAGLGVLGQVMAVQHLVIYINAQVLLLVQRHSKRLYL